ncbi:hypothetical protein BC629DRAFT_1595853 [Irpex lacteus]|nr:hypothetical protein BC629DRAFT_1595853 [Irpex lacteus]
MSLKDGMVLGADTHAMEGPIAADRNREKTAYTVILQRDCQCRTYDQKKAQSSHGNDRAEVNAFLSHNSQTYSYCSMDKLPYVTMGTGSLAAIAIFHPQYPNLEREEPLHLVAHTISASIFNELGSGFNVDVCVIIATGTEMLMNFVRPDERVKERWYVFRTGTMVLKEKSYYVDLAPGGYDHDPRCCGSPTI